MGFNSGFKGLTTVSASHNKTARFYLFLLKLCSPLWTLAYSTVLLHYFRSLATTWPYLIPTIVRSINFISASSTAFRFSMFITFWQSVCAPTFLHYSFLQYPYHVNLLKPTGHVMHLQFNIQQLYALPTLYLCSVFIWDQTATSATYSIHWLVFITEMKSVYSAVRTGTSNKAVCASSLKG